MSMKYWLGALLLAIGVVAAGCSRKEAGDPAAKGEAYALYIHCGLSNPLEFGGRTWLPIDPALRRLHNVPEGFGGDGNEDEGKMFRQDRDTLIYTSSTGQRVEYAPTKKMSEGCE